MRRAILVIIGMVIALAGGTEPATAQEYRDYAECARLLAGGDVGGAVEAGRQALDALRAAKPGLPALAATEKRAKAIEDSGTLAVFKLKAIAQSAGAKARSPFLYTAPSPREFLKQVQNLLGLSSVSYEGLDSAEADCLRFYVATLLSRTDAAAIDMYLSTAAADLDERGHSEAKAYLIAYVAGTHDGKSYPAVLRLLAEKTPDHVSPAVLVETSLTKLISEVAAWEAFEAVDSARGWKEDERLRLLALIVQKAKEDREYEWAAKAYRVLAAQEGAAGEQAQRAIISMYAEEVKDFHSAITECEAYLTRFPREASATNVEYLKASYEYEAAKYAAALSDAQTFAKGHPDSTLLPNAILLQGLSQMALGNAEQAISSFDELIRKYPQHELAGKAEFLKGSVYLSNQKYAEAREAFQRVVDFYSEDSNVPKAKECLKGLESVISRLR